MSELADSPSSGLSPPSCQSPVSLEDLELLLAEGLTSPEPLSLGVSEPSRPESSSPAPEPDTSKRWKQLEQWVADLRAEVAHLRAHRERGERATLRLLRELLQVRARVQLQAVELRQLRQELRQAPRAPEKELLEVPEPQNQTQMQALDKRLVEVREALAQIRRRQALQDSERKGAEQEANLRLAKLTSLLRQEEQGREAACSALQKSQEDSSQKVDREVAKMQHRATNIPFRAVGGCFETAAAEWTSAGTLRAWGFRRVALGKKVARPVVRPVGTLAERGHPGAQILGPHPAARAQPGPGQGLSARVDGRRAWCREEGAWSPGPADRDGAGLCLSPSRPWSTGSAALGRGGVRVWPPCSCSRPQAPAVPGARDVTCTLLPAPSASGLGCRGCLHPCELGPQGLMTRTLVFWGQWPHPPCLPCPGVAPGGERDVLQAAAGDAEPSPGPGDQAGGGGEPPLPEEGGQAVWLPAEELRGAGAEDEGLGELAAGGRGRPAGGAAEADGGARAGPVGAAKAGRGPSAGPVPGPGRSRGPANGVCAAEPDVAEPHPAGRAEGPVCLEESQAGDLASYVQENLEAVQLAGELARQETQGALELLQKKSQAVEGSVAELAQQLKDLSDHCLALSWRLDLQEQRLGLRLAEVKTEWEGVERKSLEDLARWQKEVAGRLREVREKVDGLPQQIEGVSDTCVFHKSSMDLRITAEGKTREAAVEAVRQELTTLLTAVQLLKEDSPGRKIAEIQGQLATFQKQMMRLENSIQAHKTIQNLKFNTETKLRAEEMAALRESMLRLWSAEGPWPLALGSPRAPESLAGQRCFIKDVAPGAVVPVNCWGVFQAVRWLRWKAVLLSLVAPQRPDAVSRTSHQGPTPRLPALSLSPK